MSLAQALIDLPRRMATNIRAGGATRELREVNVTPELMAALRNSASKSGVPVTPDGALRLTAVLGSVLMIAESLSSVPLTLYERQANGGRRALTGHPLHRIWHDQANPLMTAMDVRSMMLAHMLLYGNAFAEIEFDEDGFPAALWPMDPRRVGVMVGADRRVTYTYWSDEFGVQGLPAWRVHHQRGLAMSGVMGLSPIRTAMNAVGLGLATEEFGALYFVNGAAPSVVLSHPGRLTPDAVKNLRKSFEMQWSGLSNAHRIAVVGESVKPEIMSVPLDEAQFLEVRQFQVKEIARLFRMPIGMLGETETATYASAEQEMLRFRELTLGPWAERMEKAIARDMLTTAEQRSMFVQHTMAKLQATDLRTRFETYQIAKLSGLMTTNELREMEDRNPLPGGDTLWMPLNMEAVGSDGAAREERAAFAPLIDDLRRRIERRVANDVRQAGAKAQRRGGADGLAAWLDGMRGEWDAAAAEMSAPLAGLTGAVPTGEWLANAEREATAMLAEEMEAQ
jgi:HK97 family phage portal protein